MAVTLRGGGEEVKEKELFLTLKNKHKILTAIKLEGDGANGLNGTAIKK